MVTGLGMATSLGFGMEVNWERMLDGESEIAENPPEDFLPPISLPVRLGAPVNREQLAEKIRRAVRRSIWNTSSEVCHLWILTALEALAGAGVRPSGAEGGPAGMSEVDPTRVGIFVGTSAGSVRFIEHEYANMYTAEKAVHRDVSRMGVTKYMASSLAAQLSLVTGFRGEAFTVNSACSSGAQAILAALDALRLGRLDCAVAGGAEMPMGGTVLKGFSNLGALSKRGDLGPGASRPFDRDRDGFVLGEGAACLFLETESHAQGRGVAALARLAGGASAAEAHGLLSQKEDGSEIARCIELALADAGMTRGAVRHVQAHGTGTPNNDRCEALALSRLFPHRPTVSASKALLGHTIGAGAAIDAALAVRTLVTGRPLPVRHVERPDPECDLNLAGEGGTLDGGAVLVNSCAFGGHNAALLFTRAQAHSADQGAGKA